MIISFYMLGPVYGVITSTIYWIILTFRAGDILGPAMKYAAVLSMILGYWAAVRVAQGKKRVIQLIAGLASAVVFRVLVMSLFNYWVILFVAPFYFDFIKGLLSATGFPHTTVTDVMAWTLSITAIYNLTHTLLSVIPGFYITNITKKRLQT